MYLMSDKNGMESIDLGPMNIWCEFEKKISWKTLLCRRHMKKYEVVPLVDTKVVKMYWDLGHGPKNIWYEFEEGQLKTHLCRVHIVEKKVGPLVAKNITNG